MTASAQYNYNRRNSSTTPYTIPTKNNHPHTSLHNSHSHVHSHQNHGSLIVNPPPLSTSVPTLSREFVVRRISEGETGRLKEELRCEACGKGYKHISSLAKHLWEHTPEWNVTKKLLISKHQQVQLLEAASILVGMNDLPSNPSSRRNSLVEDPSYQSSGKRDDADPHSKMKLDSHHLPTHPENTSNHLKFKTSYISESHDSRPSHSNYQRSNSISQYPPSTEHTQNSYQSPAIGGYLDNHRDSIIKSRSNSIFTSTQYDDALKSEYDDSHNLKSPPSSYKQLPSLPAHAQIDAGSKSLSASILTPSSTLTSPRGISPNSDDQDDFFQEEVIGKME